MRILVIEEWSAATDSLIQELHTGLGCDIEHAGTLDVGLSKIMARRGNVDILLYTLAPTSSDALAFPERVRAMADDALFRRPQLVLLTSAPLALPCAAKCMDRQVIYLLRDFPKQVVETVRVLFWKIRTSKSGPTIRIDFRGGYYRFYVCGLSHSEEIAVSRQIGKLLLLLLRGTYTVDALAVELDVLPQTIKKYMRVLRVVLELILEQMKIADPNLEIAWMKRGAGGTLCGLRANPIWS